MPYVTGSNVPGYLPDETPSPAATWPDAALALLDEIEAESERAHEALEGDALQDSARAALDELRDAALAEIADAPYGHSLDVRFNGRVFFIAKEAD